MAQQAQQAPQRQSRLDPRSRRTIPHPLENLTLQETLRVMDVAREIRENRQNAEEMFRRDDLRGDLREKLVRTAQMSGEDVTEAEIDAAIGQYMDRLHTFQEPASGVNRLLAHAWVWRGRIAAGIAAIATVLGGLWFFL